MHAHTHSLMLCMQAHTLTHVVHAGTHTLTHVNASQGQLCLEVEVSHSPQAGWRGDGAFLVVVNIGCIWTV